MCLIETCYLLDCYLSGCVLSVQITHTREHGYRLWVLNHEMTFNTCFVCYWRRSLYVLSVAVTSCNGATYALVVLCCEDT